MVLGLAKNPPKPSSLQMENTFLPELCDGSGKVVFNSNFLIQQLTITYFQKICFVLSTESGDYLALDLGGTNFRVILLRIKAGAVDSEEVQYYQVPENVRLGPGSELFDFLAECIHSFMDNRQLKGKNLPLGIIFNLKINNTELVHLTFPNLDTIFTGFTFSFPMTQKGLDVGILVSWTKSFNCSGVVGEDAVKMLNDAIHRRGDTDVDVIAVLNDTTGESKHIKV